MKKLLLYGLSAVAAGCAAPERAGPDPSNPAAPAPSAGYGSAFESYSGYKEQGPADWRQLNDEAARTGGHAGIFRAGPAPKERQ
jgi:hypothetical protein